MPSEEFDDPDTNYYILTKELQQRIQNIQLDRQSIRDPELRGHAERIYSELKAEYFRLSKDYIALVAMTQDIRSPNVEGDIENLLNEEEK